MQYLRDNNGILESSADGLTWKEVFLNTGEPLKIGGLQLRDNAGALEVSDDDGATWSPVGGDTIPGEIANPTTIGQFQIRDNAGTLEFSDDGEIWWEFYSSDWNLDLSSKRFHPPRIAQTSDPAASMYNGAVVLWENTDDSSRWLIYKDSSGTAHRLNLQQAPAQIRINLAGNPEISDDGVYWYEIYRVGYTELTDNYFVPPSVEQGTEPDDGNPLLENEGSLVIWRDSTLSKTWLLYNNNGTIKKVELT